LAGGFFDGFGFGSLKLSGTMEPIINFSLLLVMAANVPGVGGFIFFP
jgi:hypothetical protein